MRDFNVEDHPRSIQYRLMRFMDKFGNSSIKWSEKYGERIKS